jgi:hypothetical protein
MITIKQAAELFRTKYNLQNTTNDNFIDLHDSLHYFTNIGVTLEDETEIANITKQIVSGDWQTKWQIPFSICSLLQSEIIKERKALQERINNL